MSGEAVLSLPISAIASTQVYSPLPPAEAGPATGGVTLVNTKPAMDTFAFSVQGLLPRPRLDIDGGVALEAWHPTFGLSGPLVKGRAWLSEAVEYRWERFQTTTVVGKQDTSISGWTSFTRLDMKPRGSHHVTLRLIVTPDSSSHYGLGAFEPADTVPDLKKTGVSAAVTDRVALGDHSTLDSYVHVKRVQLEMTSGGNLPYVIGHERVAGNYFKNLNQTASRVEVGATLATGVVKWRGEHLIKAGAAIGYATVTGVEASRPVDYVRSNGTLARRYEFSGAGAFDASLVDGGFFAQDTWALRPGLRVDLGARWDASTAASGLALWPRAVVSYDLRPNSTKVSSGIGVFADKALLAAPVFPDRQARRELLYDESGQHLQSSRLFTNRTQGPIGTAHSIIWNVQLDQTLKGGWMARLAYQERVGRGDYAVQPTVTGPYDGVLVLTGDATSRSRSFEVTTGFRSAHGAQQAYVSYVRSSAEGVLNDLNSVAGNRGPAQVLPDAFAPLNADVPHRLLTWGMFSLPCHLTLSPFLEVRSGFPFTRIDEEWNVVGSRNDSRFPLFVSLDLAGEFSFTVPPGIPMRLGLKLFNATGRKNGRAIQRDVERPDFGQVYDPVGRQLRERRDFLEPLGEAPLPSPGLAVVNPGSIFPFVFLELHHVWPFKVAYHQAQEGRRRRQARPRLHPDHQGADRGGPGGRGRPRHEPAARTIIAESKAVNMPAENIKRAIRRGTGEEPGVNYEEVVYEAYGPGGTAIILEGLTDNKNRTVGELATCWTSTTARWPTATRPCASSPSAARSSLTRGRWRRTR